MIQLQRGCIGFLGITFLMIALVVDDQITVTPVMAAPCATSDQYSLVCVSGGYFGSRIDVYDLGGNLVSALQLSDSMTFDTYDAATPYWGASVAVSGDMVVVGSPSAWSEGNTYLYDAPSGAFLRELVPDITLSGGTGRSQYGHSVDLEGRFVAASAPQHGFEFGGDPGQGAVFVFDAYTGVVLQKVFNDPGNVDPISIGARVDIAGDELVVYADGPGGAVVEWRRFALVPEPQGFIVALFALAGSSSFVRLRRRADESIA